MTLFSLPTLRTSYEILVVGEICSTLCALWRAATLFYLLRSYAIVFDGPMENPVPEL